MADYRYMMVMLTSPDEVKADSYVNNNLDDGQVGNAIRNAQNVYLKEVIGRPLLERLQSLVYGRIQETGATIDDEEYAIYKELLDIYVEPYLIAKAQALLTVPISFKLRNMGVVQDSDTNVANVGMGTAKDYHLWLETEVCHCATEISKFLCEHKSEFPELNCKCGEQTPKLGVKYVNVNLNLGLGGGRCCK